MGIVTIIIFILIYYFGFKAMSKNIIDEKSRNIIYDLMDDKIDYCDNVILRCYLNIDKYELVFFLNDIEYIEEINKPDYIFDLEISQYKTVGKLKAIKRQKKLTSYIWMKR